MEPLIALPQGQYIALASRQLGLSSLAVSLAQGPASSARWRLRVSVQLPKANLDLGELVASSPSAGARPSRVVLVCWCPGAESWNVQASLAGGNPSAVEQIELTAGTCCGGPAWQPREGPGSGGLGGWQYWTQTLAGPGAIAVPATFFPVGIATWTTGPGGTLQVGAGPAIPLPPTGALTLAPPIIDGRPTQAGGISVTTAGAIGATVVESVFQ